MLLKISLNRIYYPVEHLLPPLPLIPHPLPLT